MIHSLVNSRNTIGSSLPPEEVLAAIERGVASDEALAKTCGNRVDFSTALNGEEFKIGKRYKPKSCFARSLFGRVAPNGSGSLITYWFSLNPTHLFVVIPFICLFAVTFLIASYATRADDSSYSIGCALFAVLLLLSTPLTRRYEEAVLTRYLRGILSSGELRAAESAYHAARK